MTIRFLAKDKIYMLCFILILFLGLFLRIYSLATNPNGFFCDEAAIGYDAYKLLHTGKDQFGQPFPVFFKSLDDYRHPLPVYSAMPFIYIFGLNEAGVRLYSVFYGMLGIVLLYLFGKELGTKFTGLTAAFVGATMPWLIHYSRTGFEFTIYGTFFLLTALVFIKTEKNKRWIIPSFIIAAISIYTYQPAKLLIPLLVLGYCVIYRDLLSKNKKEFFIGIIIFSFLCIPVVLSFLNGQGTARFNSVSVFSANLSTSGIINRVFNNYFFQFSPTLFLTGEGTPISRHFINGLHPLLLVTIPFSIFGIIIILVSIKKRAFQFLLFWLIIYPIAGAVVASSPFTSRSIIGAPIFSILISLGVIPIIRLGKNEMQKLILTLVFLVLVLMNMYYFINFYFRIYPLYSSGYWGWQSGPREIINYFVQTESKYDDEILQPEFNRPDIFIKFYQPENCSKCKLGTPDNSYVSNKKQLFALTPLYLKIHPEYMYYPVKRIYYPNGEIGFIITEVRYKL